MTNEMVITSNETLTEKFFTTTGRINRLTFLKRNIGLLAVEVVAILMFEVFVAIVTWGTETLPVWALVASAGMMLLALVPTYCLNVKRLHDIGKDSTLAKIFLGVDLFSLAYGWTSTGPEMTPLMIILSVASLAAFLYLLFAKGEPNDNEYGAAQ